MLMFVHDSSFQPYSKMTGKKKKRKKENSSMYVSIIPFPNICGLTNKLTRKIMSETQEWWRMGVTKQGNIKKKKIIIINK